MTLHPQSVELLAVLAGWEAESGGALTIAEMRRDMRKEAYRGERLELPEVRDLAVPGPGGEIPVRLYRPEPSAAGPLPVLIYFHGGGWVLGDIDAVDAICRKLAAGVGCAVVNVGYRLAPEHPFPAAVEDAWAVTAHVAGHPEAYGTDARAVAVAGDSAGGTLATVVAGLAVERGLDLAHQLLIYPPTDTAMDTPSYAEFGDGYALHASGMAWFLDLYAGNADRGDPRMAPLRARSLEGLAPATVITAECDVLRDEAEAYAARLAAEGVAVELRCYDGMVHSFFVLPEIFDAAIEARQWAADRLRTAFAEAVRVGRVA